MSQRASTALDDGIDLSTSWTWLNSTVTNGGHRRFVDRYVRSPPEVQEWMEEIAAAGPRKRKIMAKAARMAIQQVRKETGRDEHGRLLRRKERIDLPEDQTNEDNNLKRANVPLDESLKTESNFRLSETLKEHLESTRIAEITGWAPEEVQMKRHEAELAGEDLEDVVAAAAAAAAAKSYDRPTVKHSARTTVKHTARTTVGAAVEPTVGVIGKTTKKGKKGKEPETATLCEE